MICRPPSNMEVLFGPSAFFTHQPQPEIYRRARYKTTDMGKTRKAMMAFIDSIPDSKLEGGFKSDTIYTDLKNFRLDNQGITTARGDKPACVNLQMQVNKRPKITSLADAAPFSVAHVEIPVEESWSAETIKLELKKSCIAHGDKTGHF